MPTFLHKYNSETVINGNIKIAKKEFMHKGSANDFKDAINYAASISLQKLYSSSFMTFRLSADMDRKVRGNRIDVDYKNYQFNYDYTQQVLPGLILRGDFQYKQRVYADYSNLFKNTRKDKGFRTGLTATKKLTPTVFLEGKVFYEKTNSNQAVFAFDKTIFNVAISKSF